MLAHHKHDGPRDPGAVGWSDQERTKLRNGAAAERARRVQGRPGEPGRGEVAAVGDLTLNPAGMSNVCSNGETNPAGCRWSPEAWSHDRRGLAPDPATLRRRGGRAPAPRARR